MVSVKAVRASKVTFGRTFSTTHLSALAESGLSFSACMTDIMKVRRIPEYENLHFRIQFGCNRAFDTFNLSIKIVKAFRQVA